MEVIPVSRVRKETKGQDASEFRLDGRVALITGGSGGIGRACGDVLVQRGAMVALFDLDGPALEESIAQISGAGEVRGFRGDVSISADADAAVKECLSIWGRLDILVTCAGVLGPRRPTWEYTDEEWLQVHSVDLTGVFNFCRAAVKEMLVREWGRIVNVSSASAIDPRTNLCAYSSSKAGVIALTKVLAKEVAKKGILVNAVAPGAVDTPLLRSNISSGTSMETYAERSPLGRLGQPRELGQLIAFLVSEQLSYSTGAVYDFSGGRLP